MKQWTIPVTWECCGKVEVEANTLAEAIAIASDENEDIPLPADSDYIDGSWHITEATEDEIRALYNDDEPDASDVIVIVEGGRVIKTLRQKDSDITVEVIDLDSDVPARAKEAKAYADKVLSDKGYEEY